MSERFYHEEHVWVSEGGDELIMGISDYAQNEMGDIIYVELPEQGSSIAAGEPFATLESAKAVQDLVAPLTGKVVRHNEELLDFPEVINEEPYGGGWLIAVAPDEQFDAEQLMSQAEYDEFLSGK